MREMKNSGVAWIGEIPKDWDLSRLKFSSTYNDESIKEDTNPEKEIEYVEIGSVTLENGVEKAEVMRFKDAPSRARRIARKGDIIISTVRTYLKAIALIEKESYTVSTGFCVIRPQKCMDSGYLKYFCSSELFTSEVSACSVGISYPAINASTLMDFHIINPPLAVQHKIVRVLDEKCNHVDSLIANVQAQIEKLKTYKQSLITEVVTKGLDPNAPMKDSGVEWIGKIPSHWRVTRIKNLFELRNERNTEADLANVNLISLYTDLGVMQHSDIIETTGNRAVTAEGYKIVHNNDIVVNIILCWMGAIGMSKYDGVTSPAYDVYRPINGTDSEYYHYLFRTNRFSGECYRYGRGIMMMRWRTYSSEFRSISVPCPPEDEQKQIVASLNRKCSQIDQLISLKESKIEKLQQYKRSLIYEFVTGKKEVV